jgi:hypothetical protein
MSTTEGARTPRVTSSSKIWVSRAAGEIIPIGKTRVMAGVGIGVEAL